MNIYINSKVECKINKYENKIKCTYSSPRITEDRNISFIWTNPSKFIEREKSFIMSKNHGSIYDYRFIKNREIGEWNVKVFDDLNNFIVETNFILR